MAEVVGAEAQVGSSENQGGAHRVNVARTLVSIGFIALSAGIAYAAMRATLDRPPIDPTTERIRSLIEEANRLLKELDDKNSG
jgi:hypothetical protein